MSKDFDLLEFITSQTTPKRFQEGGETVPWAAPTAIAPKPGTTGSLGGYDVGAWDADAFLATQANIAATAGSLEGAETGQMQQQQDRRDELKTELAKIGMAGKVNFLSNDQVNDLYNKMKTGEPLTANLVRSYPTETKISESVPAVFTDPSLYSDATLGADASVVGDAIDTVLSDLADDQAFGDLVQNVGIGASISAATVNSLWAQPNSQAACASQGMDYNGFYCVPRQGGFTPPKVVQKAGEIAEDIIDTVVPGVLNTKVGEVIQKGGEKVAGAIEAGFEFLVGGLLDGWNKDVIIGTDGSIDVQITPPNTPPTGQTAGATVGQSTTGETTVVIDTGSEVGNLILRGGTVGDVVDVSSQSGGEGQMTQSQIMKQVACLAQGKDYNPVTEQCRTRQNTTTTTSTSTSTSSTSTSTSTCPSTATNEGRRDKPIPEGETEAWCNGKTTVTVGGKTSAQKCEELSYATTNIIECTPFWKMCGDTPTLKTKTCPDDTITTASSITCWNANGESKVVTAASCPTDFPLTSNPFDSDDTVATVPISCWDADGTPVTPIDDSTCPPGSTSTKPAPTPTAQSKCKDSGGTWDFDNKICADCPDNKENLFGVCVDKCPDGQERKNGVCVDVVPTQCPTGTDKVGQTIPDGETVAWCTDVVPTQCPTGTDKVGQTIPDGETVAWCTDVVPTQCPTGTDKVGQTIPDGETVAWCTNVVPTQCPTGTDKVGQTIPDGETVAWCTNVVPTQCPTGTDKVGQTIPDGETVAWCTNVVPTQCPTGTDKVGQTIPDGETVAWCTNVVPTQCPTGTDKVGQTIPDGETVAWCTNVANTCPDNTDKAGQTIPDGQTVAWCTNVANTCPDNTDKAGQTIPDGQTVAWCTNVANTCPDNTDKAGQTIPDGQTVAWCTNVANTCPDNTDKAGQTIPDGQTVAWCTNVANTCPDNTDKAGQTIPDGETVAWCTNVANTCPDNTDKAGQTIPDGQTVAWCTNVANTCPDNTDKAGQTIPDGQTVAWCTNVANTCPDNTDKAGQTIPDGQTVAWCTNVANTCPDNTDKAGQTIPDGQTVAWCTNVANTCPDNTDKAGQTIPDGQTVAWCKDTVVGCGDKTCPGAQKLNPVTCKCENPTPPDVCPDNTDKAGQTLPVGKDLYWCNETGGGCPPGKELVNDVCVDECGSDEERNSSGVCVKRTPTVTPPELPSFIPTSAVNVIKQEKPDLVNIDYFYDIGGKSIFAPTIRREEEGETRAKKGGIIGKSNAVDDIVRLLRGK